MTDFKHESCLKHYFHHCINVLDIIFLSKMARSVSSVSVHLLFLWLWIVIYCTLCIFKCLNILLMVPQYKSSQNPHWALQHFCLQLYYTSTWRSSFCVCLFTHWSRVMWLYTEKSIRGGRSMCTCEEHICTSKSTFYTHY